MICLPAGTFSPFCRAAYSGSIQIVRKPQPVSVPSTQIHACITHLTQGLTNDPLCWLLLKWQRKTHPSIAAYAVNLVRTSGVAGLLPGHVAQPVQHTKSQLHGMFQWTQNLTWPNLTCVISHHVHAEAPQTHIRLCGTATNFATRAERPL